MAIALPVRVNGELCAIGIAGPLQRLEAAVDRHVKALRAELHALERSSVSSAFVEPSEAIHGRKHAIR